MWFSRRVLSRVEISTPSTGLSKTGHWIQILGFLALQYCPSHTISAGYNLRSNPKLASKMHSLSHSCSNDHPSRVWLWWRYIEVGMQGCTVNWPSLHTRSHIYWFMLIYKNLLGLSTPLPVSLVANYICCLQCPYCSPYFVECPQNKYCTRSLVILVYSQRQEHSAKKIVKLDNLIPKSLFKDSVMDMLTDTCSCFPTY